MGRHGRQEVGDIELFMNFTDRFASTRLWEIRVAQIPFSQRAPTGCLQYFTSPSGIIQVMSKWDNISTSPLINPIFRQTFNFAENGRHLANQNYRSCIRQETGMCSIAYEPCTEQSFRIGQRNPLIPDNMQVMSNVNMGLMGSGINPMMTGMKPVILIDIHSNRFLNSCPTTSWYSYSKCSCWSATTSSDIWGTCSDYSRNSSSSSSRSTGCCWWVHSWWWSWRFGRWWYFSCCSSTHKFFFIVAIVSISFLAKNFLIPTKSTIFLTM